MKYSVVAASVPKRIYTRAEADIYLGCAAFRERLERAGFLAPLPRNGKQEAYDVEQMDAAVSRWAAGEDMRSMSESAGERRA